MSAVVRSTLRAVVLPSPDLNAQDTPTRRLLGELGHNVTRASSPDHALSLLGAGPTDLLVVDVSNAPDNRRFIARLCELPASARPLELAIYSDKLDGDLRTIRQKIKPSRVHIFLKPLHVHGLLAVLRQIEEREESAELAGA